MRDIQTVAGEILEETEKIIVGKREKIRLIIMAVLANGHVLLDDLPGVGKTTLAAIIAGKTNKKLHRLNATQASTAQIKEIVSELHTLEAPNGVLLYLDEIQYFTKKQQQTLLEYIENGDITLIASTTENPKPNTSCSRTVSSGWKNTILTASGSTA